MNLNFLRHPLNRMRACLRSLQESRRLTDKDWRDACIRKGVPLERVKLLPDGSLDVRLAKSTINLTKSQSAFNLLAGLREMLDLDAHPATCLSWDRIRQCLLFHSGETTLMAEKYEHLYVLHEVYVTGVYDYATEAPVVVIDVGSNVGFTAIYLAQNNPNMIVVGCEPLDECFQQSLLNLDQNPHLANRVQFNNFGLSGSDSVGFIQTSPENRVRSSLIFKSDDEGSINSQRIRVNLKKASEFVAAIKRSYPDRELVIKMDCEGSEYAILEDLEGEGSLSQIRGVLMEWHAVDEDSRNATNLRQLLRRCGFDFVMHGRNDSDSITGMTYAFRAKAARC